MKIYTLEEAQRAIRMGDETALPILFIQLAPRKRANIFERNKQKHIARDCAAAIAAYMRLLSEEDLLRIQRIFVQYTSMEWYFNWNEVAASDMAKLISNEDDRFYVLALGTFHPNGYFRQRCLSELAHSGGRALPYVFLQVNNWVPEVRKEATSVALQLLEMASIEEVLKSLVSLEKASAGLRRSKESMEKIYGMIKQRFDVSDELSVNQILTMGQYSRRTCYRLLLGGMQENKKVFLLENESDSFAKYLIAEQLLSSNISNEALEKLLHIKIASVRYLAVQTRYEAQGVWDGMEDFLFDSSGGVRDYVCFHLKKHGINVTQLCVEKLRAQPIPEAVLCLGECGTREDAALIHPFLKHERPAFRRAALCAMTHLDAGQCAGLLYEFLRDEGTSEIAYKLILKGNYLYSAAQCYEDYLACENDKIQDRYYMLLCRGNRWDNLPYLIRIYHSLTLEQKRVAPLGKWWGGYVAPNDTQKKYIMDELDKAQLSDDIRKRLLFTLRSSGHFPKLK